jgi:hypothetical protein
MTDSKAAQKRDANLRTAHGASQVWENRKTQVMQEIAAENAANDAKTVRLKALRLEKEAQDAEAARLAGDKPAAPPKKRAVRRIVVS